jgi:hypothetical protein
MQELTRVVLNCQLQKKSKGPKWINKDRGSTGVLKRIEEKADLLHTAAPKGGA